MTQKNKKYFSNILNVNVKFSKSINIVEDFNNQEFIDRFICHSTLKMIVDQIFKMILDDNASQCSFTITGPYGTGKSSLIIFLAALLGRDSELHKIAKSKLNDQTKKIILFSKSKARKGYFILPTIGDIINPEEIIFKELSKQKEFLESINISIEDKKVKDILLEISKSDQVDGILLFIDEMGKCLEGILEHKTANIHFFQELAELANRSKGKFIFIGALHQFFAGYARNLPYMVRDEWAKVQGRFHDIPFSTSSEEQIELVNQSIEYIDKDNKIHADQISIDQMLNVLSKNKSILSRDSLKSSLLKCWPLHPIVSILLTQISKKSFGQNQRSIFSFLNSAEIYGFKYFLENTEYHSSKLYMPYDFFDYLYVNLSSYISMSNDSKIWNLVCQVIEKCRIKTKENSFNEENKQLYIHVIKTISLMNMLSNVSGLFCTKLLLDELFAQDISLLLNDLKEWKLIEFQYYNDAYVIADESDFNLDFEYKKYRNQFNSLETYKVLNDLNQYFEFPPIVAKKHYHTYGCMRWMNMVLGPVDQFESFLKNIRSNHENSVGFWVILLTIDAKERNIAQKILETEYDFNFPVFVSVISEDSNLKQIIDEYFILEKILDNENIRLKIGSIARTEIEDRKSILFSQLETEMNELSLNVEWFYQGQKLGVLTTKEINQKTSEVCDKIFKDTPKIKSEILNRSKPSPTANSIVKKLLKEMVKNGDKLCLDLKKGSPEYNLYQIFLAETKIHKGTETSQGFYSYPPIESELHKLWEETNKLLKSENRTFSLPEIFKHWSQPPFGIKAGLNSLYAISFILTNLSHLSIYDTQGYIFDLTEHDAIFIDEMLKNPQMISLKTQHGSMHEIAFLESVFTMINELISYYHEMKVIPQEIRQLTNSEKNELNIATKLVSLIKTLPSWVLNTLEALEPLEMKLRDAIKKASDPSLFFPNLLEIYNREKQVFEDVTSLDIKFLKEFFDKIIMLYPNLMEETAKNLARELNIHHKLGNTQWSDLRDRATYIMSKNLTNTLKEIHFIQDLSKFEGTYDNIKDLISLLVGKKDNWIDSDILKFRQELILFCQQFKKYELLAGNRKGIHIMRIGDDATYQELPFNYLNDNKLVNDIKKDLKSYLEEHINRLKKLEEISDSNENELFLSVITTTLFEYLEEEKKLQKEKFEHLEKERKLQEEKENSKKD
jgi:hypothetical protein